MAVGARKFETVSTQDWAEKGCCTTCAQKITASPKNCNNSSHRQYYENRQKKINDRRRRG